MCFWVFFLIIVLPLRFIWFVLISLGILVKADFAALGCRLGLAVLAFRLTFCFLLILGSLIGGLGINGLSFRLGIGLLGGWLRTAGARRLLSARNGCKPGLYGDTAQRLPIGTGMCILTMVSILATIWFERETTEWLVGLCGTLGLGLGPKLQVRVLANERPEQAQLERQQLLPKDPLRQKIA